MSAPLVSIVIPTRNGGARLQRAVEAILGQRTDFETELIALDSGSSDGSATFLETRATRVVRVDPREFNHGETRNLGVHDARGEFVVLTVQDAVPLGDDWLATLVAPLRRNPALAGAFARQIPRPDASTLTREYLSFWIASRTEGRTIFVESPEAYATLSPMERFQAAALDNVCAVIRRAVWTSIPFRPTPIAEDLEWGREALLAGYGLAYVPEAVVEHSHDRSAWYEFKRTFILHRQLLRLFELRTIPSARDLGRAIVSSMRFHHRLLSEANSPLVTRLRGSALAVAWPAGQYLAGINAPGLSGWRPGGV